MTPGLLPRVRMSGSRRSARHLTRSRRHSAQLSVVVGLAMILVAMVGMAAAVETVKPEWRDPEFGHRLSRLRELQRESLERPLVLLLGTSRAQNAFDPSAMDFADEPGSPRVFNFAQSASPPLKVLLTLLRILAEGIRPSAVIVEVLPLWLSADGPAETQFRGATPRLSIGDLRRLEPYCAEPSVMRSCWIETRTAPWHELRVVLMSHWSPRWLTWKERIDPQWEGMNPDGFVPFPHQFESPEIRARATARAREEHVHAFDGFRFGEMSLRALRDLVARCHAEGIPVAFVQPPVSPMFRGWFRPGVWENGESCLREFARELDVEVFPPFEGLAESDFIDRHHLLQSGSVKYSGWLADRYLKPWLAVKRVGR
jgi:hypothetical protein